MADEIQIETGPAGKLQDALLKLVKDLAYFADVVVITEKMKEITYEINRVLSTMTQEGGKLGIAVIIFTPRMKVTHPNLPGPVFDSVDIVGRVIEDPMINQVDGGTKKRAADVALALARAWHLKRDPALFDPIAIEDCSPATDGDLPQCVIYDVKAKTALKQ